MVFTRTNLYFDNAGSDLQNDPIAIGSIGSTTVYKYTYALPSSIKSSNDIYASTSMACTAFLDSDGTLLPYNLTNKVTAVNGELYIYIWLHIYGNPVSIMFGNAAGNETSDISNVGIELDFLTEL
jgi:hypothetical protein